MSEPIWRLQRVCLGSKEAPRLSDVSLEIAGGVTAVIGWSGAGKTSLLNVLAGFEKPASGAAALPARLAWLPQSGGLWPLCSALEHLRFVGVSSARAAAVLEAFDLERTSAKPGELSQGEAARLALARAVAADSTALVLDEPLAHVDPARAGRYWRMLEKFTAGKAVVFSTHEPEQVLRWASRVVCLHAGRVIFHGGVSELYDAPENEEVMNFLGPGNWFGDEAGRWLEADVRCVRPERLAVVPDGAGRFEVVESRFAGSVTETEIRDANATRVVVHRPAASLARGTKVVLRLLASLAVLACFFGCSGGEPELAVKSWKTWMLPPEGAVQPTPRSMTTGPRDQLAVLDTSGRVLIYDAEGRLLRQWKMLDVQFGRPEGIVWLKDDRLVVCDTHYHRLVWFDPNGALLRTVGRRGHGNGEFVFPVGICKDAAENLYVCEYGGHDRVQVFSREGEWLREFGSMGTGAGQFQRPSGLAWRDGKVFVADAGNNRVHVFSDGGVPLGLLGGGALALYLPYDITLGADDMFYIIEYGAGRLTKVSPDGKLLGRFGKTGTGEREFATPWGLTMDSQRRVIVGDTKNRRVAVVGL